MKATVLVDNRGMDSLPGEWGLCIFIEFQGKRILLDTGASSLFLENAEKLQLQVADVDYAVLSHAHYDHGNGMRTFFEVNDRARFYLSAGCRENCYKKRWLIKKYIGLPEGILEDYAERITYVSQVEQIAEHIFLVPHSTPGLSEIGRIERMYRKEGYRWVPDDFSHEQSLVFDTEKGLVIFNSCSHGGADTIIREVSSAFAHRPVYAMIGGFHLFNKSEETVRDFAKRVRETGIRNVYTGHCTGDAAFEILREELGTSLQQFYVGLQIHL